MKTDPILYKATRFARSGKYESAIRTLQPEVNSYHGSFKYNYLLGVSCLYAGDFGGALTWFRLANEIKMRDPLALLGLAALYLRRGEIDRAVDFYLEIQELDPKNKCAKKALKAIRKHAGADSFPVWLESGKLRSVYPPIPFPGFSLRMVFIPCAVLIAALLVTYGTLIKFRILPNPLNLRGSRGNAAEFTLSREERNAPVESGGAYRYILTRGQALDAYDKALALFTEYRDDAAKISLNRILESNAAEGLKNKSRILMGFMEVPGFDNFKRSDNVSYNEVRKDPALYRDVHVIWRGMAANPSIDIDQNTTAFEFLVGYDTRKTLEGIVSVIFDQAVPVSTERPLEVLGRVVPVSTDQGDMIRLLGVAIHQSGRLEN